MLSCRLCVALEDAEQLTRERTALEKQIQELQTRYADVEREKYDAVGKVQDCIQLLEDANLQRSQVRQSMKVFLKYSNTSITYSCEVPDYPFF